MRVPAVRVQGVCKYFSAHGEGPQGVLQHILRLARSAPTPHCIGLNEVSFAVEPGCIMGIVGRNGSGKSTLLRVIAGIYPPSKGTVNVHANKIVTIMGLGHHLHPRLTVRANIFLQCALFGMTRAATLQQYRSILLFADLENEQHTQLFQLSDGMRQRLAFSIGIHSQPDVLLMDEALSAGDHLFQQKASDALQTLLKNRKTTSIIASHDVAFITRTCDRVVWLDAGQVRECGDAAVVVAAYVAHA